VPEIDLGSVFDDHVRAEFQSKDADESVSTMTADAYLNHVPVATGASGREALRRFYDDHFIPAWPDDVEVTSISRTVGESRVVDELLMRFTHTRVMDFWLPGVAPTGRRVELPVVAVVGFEGDKIVYEHIYWDQASLLLQVGLLDPGSAPMLGVEQARKAMDDTLPSNELIDRWRRED
jgi:carboxymethylenebutenolidase